MVGILTWVKKRACKHKKHSSPLILINNLNFHHIPSLFIHHLQISFSTEFHSKRQNWLFLLFHALREWMYELLKERKTNSSQEKMRRLKKKHSPPVNSSICHNYFLCCYFFHVIFPFSSWLRLTFLYSFFVGFSPLDWHVARSKWVQVSKLFKSRLTFRKGNCNRHQARIRSMSW